MTFLEMKKKLLDAICHNLTYTIALSGEAVCVYTAETEKAIIAVAEVIWNEAQWETLRQLAADILTDV